MNKFVPGYARGRSLYQKGVKKKREIRQDSHQKNILFVESTWSLPQDAAKFKGIARLKLNTVEQLGKQNLYD